MTVIRAPRMTPLTVSSLTLCPARRLPLSALRLAILFSLQVRTGAERRRRRMAADRLPTPVILDPDIGEHNAILDQPPKVVQPPARLHGPDHHVVEDGRIAHE